MRFGKEPVVLVKIDTSSWRNSKLTREYYRIVAQVLAERKAISQQKKEGGKK